MDLFSNLASNKNINLLPFDGEVFHLGRLYTAEAAKKLFQALYELIPWQADEVVMYGKHIQTKRKTAWYGDQIYAYNYSGIQRKSKVWTADLFAVKSVVEDACKLPFNSCLLNLYHHGSEGMSWHSDDEKELGQQPAIASLSLGASRKFCFKHKSKGTKVELVLESGDLLIMKGDTQKYWKHALPLSSVVKTPRINLTFRQILSEF